MLKLELNEQQTKWAKSLVDCNFVIQRDVLDAMRWRAIAVESGCHFDDADIARIVKVARDKNIQSFNVVDLELDGLEIFSQIAADKVGLELFNRECGHFTFALFPEDKSFLFVCTPDSYFSIAGVKSDVEALAGKTIENSRLAFSEFAQESGFLPEAVKFFRRVQHRYAKGNAEQD